MARATDPLPARLPSTPAHPRPASTEACGACTRPVPPGAPWTAGRPAAVGVADGAVAPARLCSAACAARLAAVPQAQRCGACGRALAVADWPARCCPAPACRREVQLEAPARAWLAERAAVQAAAAAAGRAAAAAARDAAVAAAGGVDPARVPAVVVPTLDPGEFPHNVPVPARTLRPLPRRRRRAFAAHVRRLAAALPAAPPPPPALGAADSAAAPPAVAAALGGACGACRGRCCESAGDRAYLDAPAVARFLATHPGTAPAAVAAAYLAHVPARTVAGSCLFHGERGCGLPRAARADICNRYLCPGLEELRAALLERAAAGDPAPTAYVAVAEAPDAAGARRTLAVVRGALVPAAPAPAAPAPAV